MRRIPLLVLAAFSAINIVRGCVHAFAPDGGAPPIAGLELSGDSRTILSLFATLGFGQLVMAGFEVFALAFRRDLSDHCARAADREDSLWPGRPVLLPHLPRVVPGCALNTALLVVLAATFATAWTGSRRGRPPSRVAPKQTVSEAMPGSALDT